MREGSIEENSCCGCAFLNKMERVFLNFFTSVLYQYILYCIVY